MKNTKDNQQIWIDKIQENLILRGRCINTFINYKSALNKFFNYYSATTVLNNLTESDILTYINECFLKPNKSKYTYNLALASIRLLYTICFNKSLNNLLLPTSKTIKKIPTILSKDIFIKIFNKESNLKHKCWLILAFCSGLRVDEVANVKN